MLLFTNPFLLGRPIEIYTQVGLEKLRKSVRGILQDTELARLFTNIFLFETNPAVRVCIQLLSRVIASIGKAFHRGKPSSTSKPSQ